MRSLRLLSALALVGASLALVRCINDDSVTPPDGGPDAAGDGTVPDGGPGDAPDDSPPPPPTPDGSLAWFQHFGTSFTFEDLAVNEKGGPSFVVAGGFVSDGGQPLMMGTQSVGPARGLVDDVLATLKSSGVVWAITQQPDPIVNPDASGCQAPTANISWFSSAAVDDNGIIYVAGSASDHEFILKDDFFQPVSFVAAFSATGTPLWQHIYTVDGGVVNGVTDSFGTDTDMNNLPGKMQLAVHGNELFVSFGFNGNLSYDGDAGAPIASQNASQDVFVSALNTSNGSTLWQTTFGSTSDDTVEQITTTSAGEVLLVGSTSGTMTGPSGTGFPLPEVSDAGGVYNTYLVKLDGSGHAVYATEWGGSLDTIGGTVSYANGVVAVGGYLLGTTDFGKGPVTAQAGVDGFLVVLDDATRNVKYVASLAGNGDEYIRSAALDPWGDALVVGNYGNGSSGASSAQLGSSTLFPATLQGADAMIVAKLSPTGDVLWSHSFLPSDADGGPPSPSGIAMIEGVRARATNAGQLVVTGGMNYGADFGSGYQPLLSANTVVDYCHLVCFGGCQCRCDAPIVDGFAAAWQP